MGVETVEWRFAYGYIQPGRNVALCRAVRRGRVVMDRHGCTGEICGEGRGFRARCSLECIKVAGEVCAKCKGSYMRDMHMAFF